MTKKVSKKCRTSVIDVYGGNCLHIYNGKIKVYQNNKVVKTIVIGTQDFTKLRQNLQYTYFTEHAFTTKSHPTKLDIFIDNVFVGSVDGVDNKPYVNAPENNNNQKRAERDAEALIEKHFETYCPPDNEARQPLCDQVSKGMIVKNIPFTISGFGLREK